MTCTDTLALPFIVFLIDEGDTKVGLVSLLANVSKLTHGVNMDTVISNGKGAASFLRMMSLAKLANSGFMRDTRRVF